VRTRATDSARQVNELREGLLAWFRVLLDSERRLYDRDVERIRSPFQMLGLLLNDPWFGWLRNISRLVVEIDEALDGDSGITPGAAESMIHRAKQLIRPAEYGGHYERRYFEAMQRDPNVILAHRDMSRLLARLAA
jgi:hypothetical protein